MQPHEKTRALPMSRDIFAGGFSGTFALWESESHASDRDHRQPGVTQPGVTNDRRAGLN